MPICGVPKRRMRLGGLDRALAVLWRAQGRKESKTEEEGGCAVRGGETGKQIMSMYV
jgi:hypothetical protein